MSHPNKRPFQFSVWKLFYIISLFIYNWDSINRIIVFLCNLLKPLEPVLISVLMRYEDEINMFLREIRNIGSGLWNIMYLYILVSGLCYRITRIIHSIRNL